jgi:hypothetical protein
MTLSESQIRQVLAMDTDRRRSYYQQVERTSGKAVKDALVKQVNAVKQAERKRK